MNRSLGCGVDPILCKHLRLFDEHDPNAGRPDVPAFILPPGSKVSIT